MMLVKKQHSTVFFSGLYVKFNLLFTSYNRKTQSKIRIKPMTVHHCQNRIIVSIVQPCYNSSDERK